MEGALPLHQEPLNSPPSAALCGLAGCCLHKGPSSLMLLPCHGQEEFFQEGPLPAEKLVGAGGCCGGCPVPPGQGEGETPPTTGASLAMARGCQQLGDLQGAQEGWAREGCLPQLVPRLRKTNWSATGYPLPFGELGVCPWGLGVFCSQGGKGQQP